MIDLNVKGITIQMHIVVNDDGSFTARLGEGNISLEADEVPELTTSKAIKLNSPTPAEGEEPILMTESEMGTKLSGLIREAIEVCMDKDNSGMCTKNVKSRSDWNDVIEAETSFFDYYEDSTIKYIPPEPAPEPEEEPEE